MHRLEPACNSRAAWVVEGHKHSCKSSFQLTCCIAWTISLGVLPLGTEGGSGAGAGRGVVGAPLALAGMPTQANPATGTFRHYTHCVIWLCHADLLVIQSLKACQAS